MEKERDQSIEELEEEVRRLTGDIDKKTSEIKEKLIRKNDVVDRALYEEEVLKRKELEKKVEYLEKLLLKQQEQLAIKKSKKESSHEEIVKKLKSKHKFAYNVDRYPWMYSITEKDKESWLQEWSNFLFDFAKEFSIHIVDLASLSTQAPFSAFKENREKYIREIMNYLAKNTQLAEWVNNEKTRLRIYWCSLQEWSEKLHDYMFLNGLEIATLLDIKDKGKEIVKGFDTLPSKDLKKIIDILVKEKKASWINKKSVKFL
ncbi:MAG: hypothetical protein ACTSVE_08020, partial [Candidatus Helarchaeota archaeon]